MVRIERGRYRDKKRSALALLLFLVILTFYLMAEPQSSAVSSMIGAFVLGPLIAMALKGSPELRIESGDQMCELVSYGPPPRISVLKNGYYVREISLDEPVETVICGVPVRIYMAPAKISGSRIVVEIEGKKYYLP